MLTCSIVSGHGKQRKSGTGEEGDSFDEGIVGCDGKRLWDNEICDRFIRKLPPNLFLTAIMDCCHAGTNLDLEHYRCNNSEDKFPTSQGDPLRTPSCDGKCLENLKVGQPRILSLAAAVDGKLSWDGSDGQSMTSCMLDILDANPEGISWEDLGTELQARISVYQEGLRTDYQNNPEKFASQGLSVEPQIPVFGGDQKLNLKENVEF